jgi:alpha-glucosidase
VKAGAIVPMYPEMLHDREKPKDPVTLDIYPFGKTSFSLYEDDGVTQQYRTGGFARTAIEVTAPKALDDPGGQVVVKVAPARGTYKDMPAARSYVLDVHVPAKPASVRLGAHALPLFEVPPAGRGGDRAAREKARAAFDAAAEGWLFDPSDRRGVLHVRLAPQAAATGFTVTVGM